MTASARLRQTSARFRSLPEQLVRVGADALNESIMQQLRADTGGDQRLSGFGRRGKKMATTTRISGGGRIASAVIRARGPQWAIVEKGADPHLVGRRRDGKGGLHMNAGGGWRTGPWRVSGSPAKRTLSKGRDRGRAPALAAMEALKRQAVG